MRMKRILAFFPFLLLMKGVEAHCPLCTVGAAVAAGGAAYLGVHSAVIGLLIGAFAVSTGWWASRWIKKRYIPGQKVMIILLSFALTVIPILPIIGENYPLYISLAGEYGSLLHRTYVVNISLVTSIFGGILVSISPRLSKKISLLRDGRVFPFQGVVLTLSLLVVASIILQVLM